MSNLDIILGQRIYVPDSEIDEFIEYMKKEIDGDG